MRDTLKSIDYARQQSGITQDFVCYGDPPTTEQEYIERVKWVAGVDADRNVIFGNTQLVSWQQVQQYASEAEQNWKLTLVRKERDKRLAETDWWAVADRTITQQQKDYRQALRDITDNCNPQLDEYDQLIISSINWPEKP